MSKTPFGSPAYTLSATGGSGPFYRATVDLNQPFTPSVAGRFNAMFQDAEVVGRNFVEVQRWGVASFTGPSASAARPSSPWSYWYQAEDERPDYGLPYLFGEPADVSRKNWYGLANRDYEETNVHIATARFDHAFTDNIRMRDTLRWASGHVLTVTRRMARPIAATTKQPLSQTRPAT